MLGETASVSCLFKKDTKILFDHKKVTKWVKNVETINFEKNTKIALGWLLKADKFNTIEEYCYETKFSKNTKLVFNNSCIICLNYSIPKTYINSNNHFYDV